MQENKYKAQKKHLDNKKQLRVWVDAEKYERFKKLVEHNGTSIYALVNEMIDNYCKQEAGE